MKTTKKFILAKDLNKNHLIKYNNRFRLITEVNFDTIENFKKEKIEVVKIKFTGFKNKPSLIGLIYINDLVELK